MMDLNKNEKKLLDKLIITDNPSIEWKLYRTRKNIIDFNNVNEYYYPPKIINNKLISIGRANQLGESVFYATFTIDSSIHESYNLSYKSINNVNDDNPFCKLPNYYSKINCYCSEWILNSVAPKYFKYAICYYDENYFNKIKQQNNINNEEFEKLKNYLNKISKFFTTPNKCYYRKTSEISHYLLKKCDFIIYKSVKTNVTLTKKSIIDTPITLFMLDCIVCKPDFVDKFLNLNVIYYITYRETINQIQKLINQRIHFTDACITFRSTIEKYMEITDNKITKWESGERINRHYS